jgi:2-dehydro-3-deoxyphosphogluconate aldolase/(4S)-4-hydroxy-2-oxoglutarate aldolase
MPIVPVVTIDDPTAAAPLVAALQSGGINCAEFVLRTPNAIDAIEAVSTTPNFLVGAGTVVTAKQVDAVYRAGAQFLVSPGLGTDVIERAEQVGLPLIPGIASASEAQAAARLGLTYVKLFPAEIVGGLKLIEALSAPFPGLRFLPSGGIGPANAVDYRRHPSVFAVSGSWMVPAKAIAERDFDLIAQLARAATDLLGTVDD